jgi:alkylhydroperoxidase family enzyme
MAARITPISRPGDRPDAALAELFATLFPGRDDPHFDANHDGMAIAAHSPRLALALGRMGALIVGELPFSQRQDLRELAIQTVNRRFACDYAFASRVATGEGLGLSAALQEALPEAPLDGEQALVVAYADAVASGRVPPELTARAVAAWGEKGAVEATALVAFFGFWAMFLNATR